MKKTVLLLTLTLSAPVFAEKQSIIFPQVYNYGYRVDVSVWNHTDRSVNCSGPVYMTYESGASSSEYFHDYVPARLTSHRSVYPRANERIRRVTHSIYCF